MPDVDFDSDPDPDFEGAYKGVKGRRSRVRVRVRYPALKGFVFSAKKDVAKKY